MEVELSNPCGSFIIGCYGIMWVVGEVLWSSLTRYLYARTSIWVSSYHD
ncbi:unnamed protein product [Prunus brigantina]